MMGSRWSRWLSGAGGVALVGCLVLANYGGGVTPVEAHGYNQNPFKQILGKLNEILAKLNNSGGGGGAGNYVMRWDTRNASASRFTVLTDFDGAAVRDSNTGLVWEQSQLMGTPGSPWTDARLQCLNKNVGGTRGWRLPSVAELASLIDPSLPPPFVPGVFTGVQLAGYWSATSIADGGSINKFSVSFQDGSVGTTPKSSTASVWCVRGSMQESVY